MLSGEALDDHVPAPPEEAGCRAEFARQIDVPANRVSQIIAGKRAVTGDTALRFGHWFEMEPRYWLHLQAEHDLAVADRETGAAIRQLPTKSNLRPHGAQSRLV